MKREKLPSSPIQNPKSLHPEAKATLDVTFQIGTSTTLGAGSWTPAAATDATENIKHSPPPGQPGGERFARLKVTKP